MTIVGFNFTKIEAEKKDLIKGKININNNVSINKVEEKDLALGNQKQKVLKFTFEFIAKYDPNVGFIKFTGDVLFMDDSKKIKEILDGWKKDKKLLLKHLLHVSIFFFLIYRLTYNPLNLIFLPA